MKKEYIRGNFKVTKRNTVLILGQEISVFHPAAQEYIERNYSLEYYMELCKLTVTSQQNTK